jgi:nicotinamide-nucleotide amidase
MRPMFAAYLAAYLAGFPEGPAAPFTVRCAGVPESDLQLAAQDVLGGRADIELTVLAALGDVRAVLFDRGAGAEALAAAGQALAEHLGATCYSTDGRTLAQVVLDTARAAGVTIATSESCTGGLVSGALTAIPGSSDVFLGGVVSYADDVKTAVLGVDPALLTSFGAVSEPVARAMALGAVDVTGADYSVAVTGIAGPSGGTEDKPVGTVWFAVASPSGVSAACRRFMGDREAVRERSTITALDLLRRSLTQS